MAVEYKKTTIISQWEEDSTASQAFTTLDGAKDFYLTANAQECNEDHTTQVAYAIMADDNGNNTKLKMTLGFDNSGQGAAYNLRFIELLNANDWLKPQPHKSAKIPEESPENPNHAICTDDSNHLF